MNYESDGSTTNLNSCNVFFFLNQNGLSKGVTQHRQYSTSGGHRSKVNFVTEPCVGALLQNETCGSFQSFHFHTLDSRGPTRFSVEVRYACIFVTTNMCTSNISQSSIYYIIYIHCNMHAGEL